MTKGEIEALIGEAREKADYLLNHCHTVGAHREGDLYLRLADALALTRVDKSINASQGLGTTVCSALEGLLAHFEDRVQMWAQFRADDAAHSIGWNRSDAWLNAMQHSAVQARQALSSAKQNEGDRSRDELNTSSQPVKIPPDTEHDGGEVLSRWKPTHRHVKRGSEYQVIAFGELQTAEMIADETAVVIYLGGNGAYYVRPTAEFNDGRFEILPPPPRTGGE